MYVGKALHNGDWLPAKVVPRRNEAYVAHGGQEHVKSNIQVINNKCPFYYEILR